jgi:hypothetical protein
MIGHPFGSESGPEKRHRRLTNPILKSVIRKWMDGIARGQVIGIRIVSGFGADEWSAAICRMKVEETRGGYDTPAF